MSLTPNFGFNIPESTDIVNLLTQCYPNFTIADTAMQAIKAQGISQATESKSGTVHNIVRVDSDCSVFWFTATSNFATGDTFTVDGSPVSAVKVSGAGLETGDFVINSNVPCIVKGGVLTVLAGGGSSTVLAEDVTYDNTVSGLTATDVQDAIDELKADIPTGFSASAISYDNTGSGLTATDAQDAIDEVADRNVYSTSEKAIGKWIDGRTVYRKAYYGTSTFNAEFVVDATVTNANAELISFYGCAKHTNNECTPFYDNVTGSPRTRVMPYFTSAGIKLVVSNFTGNGYVLVADYVKLP